MFFLQNLVNYFNPAFSWYESLFGPTDFQKTLAAFPIVLQGSGATRRSQPSAGSTTPGFRAGAPSRFFINDNLAWTVAAHELRFGTNTRIFRLNDYDFGEGVVPTVTYATLPQFIYGVASTASETFPGRQFAAIQFSQPGSLCAGHLESDDKLTWTFGIRDHVQFQSAESSRRGGASCRIVRLRFPTMSISR